MTIDLNGFGVHQAWIYDQGGGGIVGGSHVTVKNGFVTDTNNDGIRLGADARVYDVDASGNDRDGVNVQGESIVRGVVATLNKHNGISAGTASTVDGCTATYNDSTGISLASGTLTRSTATQNIGTGATLGPKSTYSANYFESNQGGDVSGGHASAGNFCGDGSCTSDGRKRFYLSANTHLGGQATTACGAGFHMASLWELRDPSALAFASQLAQLAPQQLPLDLGRGPPSGVGWGTGWVRTGYPSYDSSSSVVGFANCSQWTSSSASQQGAWVALDASWSDAGPVDQSPWAAGNDACDETRKVWCIED